MKRIIDGDVYRYYDESAGIDCQLIIRHVKTGMVHASLDNGKQVKATLAKGKLYDKSGYNLLGFDIEEFDERGYDANGFNRNGVDIEGIDKHGKKVTTTAAYDPSCYAGTPTTYRSK